jgi:protein-tyrosine phosphatase
MAEKHSRQIEFENIPNFRDIGGYRTREGNTVAWRRLFRSAGINRMTDRDLEKLRQELGLMSVIDLRSDFEIKHQGTGLISGTGIKYYNVAFLSDGKDSQEDIREFNEFPNMGEFYVHLVRQRRFGQRMVKALEVIAEAENHPMVFHCTVGKDRTGILAAVLLSVLGVPDEDIENDYCLTGPFIEALFEQLTNETKNMEEPFKLPDFFWRTEPESIALLMASFRKEYGSTSDYLKAHGAEPSLVNRLKASLLT